MEVEVEVLRNQVVVHLVLEVCQEFVVHPHLEVVGVRVVGVREQLQVSFLIGLWLLVYLL